MRRFPQGSRRLNGRFWTDRERFDDRYIPVPESGCWLWLGSMRGGYGAIKIDSKMSLAHRVSYEFHVGRIPDGLCVLHRCDVRCCVNPAHLFLGTHRDNTMDMIRKGRNVALSGEHHPMHTLTADAVLAMRSEFAEKGMTTRRYRELAKEHGVTWTAIQGAVRCAKWRHL